MPLLVFPITGRRYTLGGEVDVDLCKDCFEIGIAFARSHDFNDAVVIHGRTLCVENEEMTCEKIWQMSSKAIAAPSLDMEDAAIEAALKMSRGEVASSIQNPSHGEVASGMQEDSIEVLATEGFRSQIFTQLLNLAASSLVALEDQDTPSPSYYVLQLVIDIVLNSDTEELKVTRGNQLVLAFTKNMQSLIKSCQSCESSLTKKSRIKMVVCVRTLASLVMQKNEINFEPPLISSVNERNGEAHTHHKDKTDPRYVSTPVESIFGLFCLFLISISFLFIHCIDLFVKLTGFLQSGAVAHMGCIRIADFMSVALRGNIGVSVMFSTFIRHISETRHVDNLRISLCFHPR